MDTAKSILILGERGKTVVIYGLLKRFSQEGLKVGYFKPIARARYRLPSMKYIDPDVLAIKEALGLKDPVECMSPLTISRGIIELKKDIDNLKRLIIDCFNKVSEGKDVVVIESYPVTETMSSIGLPLPEIAKLLNVKSVYVAVAKDRDIIDEVVDRVYLYKCFFERYGVALDGVIFNNVPVYHVERVNDLLVPVVENLGMKVYGVISEKPRLLAPTVRDVAEALNAEVLENEDRLNNIVEDIIVGAMAPTAALRWFRRAINAAIITGGDRTDLIIAALETRPSVVILTGNLYPDVGVLIKAKEVNVPLLLVPYDTYTTIEKLREVQSIVTADSLKAKEDDIVSTIDKEVDWKKLLE